MITLAHSRDDEGFLKDLIPDLTPMLDILFILLVFFMLAVGQVFETMNLTLPKSTSQEIEQTQMDNMIVLSMGSEDGNYAINKRPITTLEGFKAGILKAVQEHPEYKIILAGDREVSLERLLSVLTFLNDNGIQTANILLQPGDK